jgi:hypothetical protein
METNETANVAEKEPQVTLNGKPVSQEELERQRGIVESQKGAKLFESSKGRFQIRLRG